MKTNTKMNVIFEVFERLWNEKKLGYIKYMAAILDEIRNPYTKDFFYTLSIIPMYFTILFLVQGCFVLCTV